MSLTSYGNISARLVWNPFDFGLLPAVLWSTLGSFVLDYKFGHLVAQTATIQPPAITVDPAPFAFLAAPSLDASQIRGQLVIEGGSQFETNGDTVYFENEDGPANPGQLVQRDVERIITAGQDQNGHTIYAPDSLNGLPIVDTYVDLEGGGLGIPTTGLQNGEGQTYYGVEITGVENVQLRLSGGNDNFTIDDTHCTGTCTFSGTGGLVTPPLLPAPVIDLYGGDGDDTVLVTGIGAPTTIYGGPGTDAVTVKSLANDLTGILSRLTVDGNNDLVTQVTQVLDNDPQQIVHDFLSTPILVVPTGAALTAPDGAIYYQASFVPILQDPDLSMSGTGLNVRTVIINPDGSLAQKLVQQRGVLEWGIQAVGVQNQNGSHQLLWARCERQRDDREHGRPVRS